MRSLSVLLLGIILIVCSSFQQNKIGETILWSPNSEPGWKDFKKSLQGNAIEAAYSVCGIDISSSPKQINDTIFLEVEAFFSKTESAKTTEKELLTNNVLTHERGHFDITELYARMLRKDIKEASFKTVEGFYNNVQVMYDKETKACKEKQDEYDKETNHSMNIKYQEKWNKEIAEELDKYSDYTSTHLKIVVRK
ncbi:MAG TPA: DUF922 domain-containing protein [Bacteroidia bacterium]|jgi:hypothetical protein|nr:DUF922 domain-containing protein [Bacteroidia bacterium]